MRDALPSLQSAAKPLMLREKLAGWPSSPVRLAAKSLSGYNLGGIRHCIYLKMVISLLGLDFLIQIRFCITASNTA